jgi:hypothetical protein
MRTVTKRPVRHLRRVESTDFSAHATLCCDCETPIIPFLKSIRHIHIDGFTEPDWPLVVSSVE